MSAEPGSYRPLPPELLYLDKHGWNALADERPIHLATGLHEPESAKVIECGVVAPRDFTPERTAQTNVYAAVSAHISDLRDAGKRVLLASYTKDSRERIPAHGSSSCWEKGGI